MSARPEKEVLRAERIRKVFSATVALDGVDFTVYRGEVNVLIGENGAGKSTLMKILAGAEQPDAGRLLMDGEEIRFKHPSDAAARGIGIIYQELNLFPNLNVAENIFVARERTRAGVVVDHRAQEAAARALLERLEQPINPRVLAGDLRLGQQQIVEIARALSQEVRVLIMDEPTSALSSAETAALFRIIGDLKSRGVAVIYISHKLEELLQIADRISVLRDGRMVAEAPAGTVDVAWMVEKMVGRGLSATRRQRSRPPGEELLQVRSLSLPRPGGGWLLESVSLALRTGEIVALYGLMGAGRTELLECLIGTRRPSRGSVLLGGKPLHRTSVAERTRLGLALIPEDRQAQGLVPDLSLADNVALASLRDLARGFYIPRRAVESGVSRLMADLAIKAAGPWQQITSLSGGNQQKAVLARFLMRSPRVLLMDEPTRGVDVGAKAEIWELMGRLAGQGLGVVFVSSELLEVMTIADRILVMSKGRVTREFAREEATEEALITAAGGNGRATEAGTCDTV